MSVASGELWGAVAVASGELWHVVIARAVHSGACVLAMNVRFHVVAVGGSLDVACVCSAVDTVHRY